MTTPEFEVREDPATFRFTFDQFEQMVDDGMFQDIWNRVELLDGRIVEMAPGSDQHGKTSAELIYLIAAGLRAAGLNAEFGVRTDGTVRIGEYSAPEPDVFVVRNFSGRTYAEASDVALLVEVSISTRADDLKIKMPMYARAGVPEAWIVEPEAGLVRLFRDPHPDGSWGHESVVTEGVVTPLFSDQVRVDLAELF